MKRKRYRQVDRMDGWMGAWQARYIHTHTQVPYRTN